MPLFFRDVATALKNNKNLSLAYLWKLMNIYALCYLVFFSPQLGVLSSLGDLWNHLGNILSL